MADTMTEALEIIEAEFHKYDEADRPSGLINGIVRLRQEKRDLLLVGRDIQRLLCDWRPNSDGTRRAEVAVYDQQEIAERRQTLARLDEALERIGGIK